MITSSNNNTRNADLFSIATSGVNASNQLLNTTGNNIANVNTEGFVRERTTFESQLTGGVGRSTTERVLNVFAQNQLRRDTTTQSEYENYYNKTSVLDNVFASEANSISSSMSRFFASLQTAADDPTSISGRQLVLGEAQSLVGQISTVSGFLRDKEEELNIEASANVNSMNSIIQSIADLNSAIRTNQANNRFDEPGTLKNQRDSAILELASLVSIETRNSGKNDGAVMVSLKSGESLVLEDGSFSVFEVNNDADLNYKSLQLTSNGRPTTLNIDESDLGGAIGGLFRYRDEVLETSRRELGQIAMSLTEALNTQNRQGMDLDQQLGGDIFSLPKFAGLSYPNNTTSSSVSGRITNGAAGEVTSADYEVTINSVGAGLPQTLDITVAALNPDGTPVTNINGIPITQNYPAIDATSGTFTSVIGGIELEFASGSGYTAGDQFLLQPTKNTADRIEVVMTRPEDLALASPMRVDANLNNLGDAKLTSTFVSNTFIDNTFGNSGASAFNNAGGIHGPGSSPTGVGGVGAPAQILFTSSNDYQVLDSAGSIITVVSGTTDLSNLLAQAESVGAGPGWPAAFSALNDYPGFDLSLQGVPKAGDSFAIGYNTDGLNDNRNGLVLADLQNQDLMQVNSSGSGEPVSFHEAYANVISDIGQKSASADISLQAAEALKSQSSDWFQSVSGVSLDEEAANLVRFQQSYAAAARLLSTAQTLFDTILAVVR